MNNTLNESSACKVAGVSIDTLRHFTDLGLLKTSLRSGVKYYSASELQSVFRNYAVNEDGGNKLQELTATENAEQEESKEADNTYTPKKVNSQSSPQTDLETAPVAKENVFTLDTKRTKDPYIESLVSQIEILKEERDWLRTQIAMQNARFEREQMLLLAESKNLRTALCHQDSSKIGRQSRFSWFKSLFWHTKPNKIS